MAGFGSNNDASPTVPAAKPVIPADFKSDDKFFDSLLWGLAIISFIVSFSRLIGLGKHRLREDPWMICECMSFVLAD